MYPKREPNLLEPEKGISLGCKWTRDHSHSHRSTTPITRSLTGSCSQLDSSRNWLQTFATKPWKELFSFPWIHPAPSPHILASHDREKQPGFISTRTHGHV